MGWDQVLKGRLSKEWEKNHDKHAKHNREADKKMNRSKWTINVIDEMWHWFLKEWQDRKDKMHGVDEIAKAQ